MTQKKHVVVAMSGGVDSSVAAALLLREGYDVTGVTMRLWTDEEADVPHRGCCVLGADDARAVCQVLGIPHHVVNLETEFAGEVVEYFCREYGRGRTPNPCLACNERMKFKHLLARARAMGADYLATGHYARIRRAGGEWELLHAVDEEKDQSYVLYTVGQEELSRLLFPVGEYRKAEVRRLAAESGLPVADKPDSVEVCFIPDDDYRSFLAGRIGQEPGDIVDRVGRVVGRHQGVAAYTIGQRHGLGVALGERRYVAAIDTFENVITIGEEEDLLSDALRAEDVCWVSGKPPRGEVSVEAKIRYRTPAAAAIVKAGDRGVEVRFRERQRAITPGQAVVFYQGERVLGGGIIATAGLPASDGGGGRTLS